MAAPELHRVRRLAWQASAPTPADALALRTLLQAQGDAVPALLARVLADAAPPGRVLRVPRLALQLRASSVQALQAELLPQLERALREALATVREAAADGTGAPGDGVIDEAQAAGWTAAFVHHLAHGDLPWPQQTLEPAAARAGLQPVAEAAAAELRAAPARGLAWLPAAVDRWPGAFARWLALLPAAVAQAWVREARAAWHADLAWPGREGFVLPAIDDAGAGDPTVAASLLAWAALRQGLPASRQADAMATLRPALARALAPALQAWGRPTADAASAVPARPQAPPPVTPSGARPTPPSVPSQVPATPARLTPPEAADPALAPLVPLAGLVLLHPYLPRLLRGLGVVDDDTRRLDDARLPRACTLLHTLACGDAAVPEFMLPVVKLLLGRAPDEPLAAPLPAATPDELAEADALLAAVRAHWPALRGTGADGLRLSFLQRRGLLSRRDGHWRLQMQHEPFDLLLGLLPWGIGFVKLPWMPRPLVVEWPAP